MSRLLLVTSAGTPSWQPWPSTSRHSTISPRQPGLSCGSCGSHGFRPNFAIQRADALVRAPAAFRKHGVYLSAADLEAA